MPNWMMFALLTALCWGVYGILLHTGVMAMGAGENSRYKAFLWVGIAYFLVAVLAPAGLLLVKGESLFDSPAKAISWSLIAGVAGAVGAFGVLLAFGAKGHPAVVMAIIFAAAPILNAIVSLSIHPPAGGWKAIDWRFFAGIVLAACGGMLVTLYKPGPGKPQAPSAGEPPVEQRDG